MSAFSSWEVARRAFTIQWIFLAAFAVLGAAFFKAQVLDYASYRTRSANTHLRAMSRSEPPRVDILDRNGKPIAENMTGYSIRLLATTEDSLRAVLTRLDALIPDDTIDAEAVVRRWKAATYQAALVYASGRYNVVATLEEHRATLPGLVIQAEPRRRYPDGDAVAHMVGYVGEVSPRDLEEHTFPNAKPGEIVGKQGLELEYDSLLRGRRGLRFVEIDAHGRMIREAPAAAAFPPTPGKIVHTTIDMGLQHFIDSMWRTDLQGKRGAMVAMTPSGEVLAYASFPSYDPNDFIGGIDATTFSDLINDPDKPLYNRVIQAAYPPASAVQAGDCGDGVAARLHDGKRKDAPARGAPGATSSAIASGDAGTPRGTGSSLCARRSRFHATCTSTSSARCLAPIRFSPRRGRWASVDGRGSTSMASITDRCWRASRRTSIPARRKVFDLGENGETLKPREIGQGAHTETLINMVSFYAALAGDGIKRAPHIIKDRPSAVTHDLKLTPEELTDLRTAMADVVNSGTATGTLAGEVGLKQFAIAGKTGSAEVTGQKQMGWFIAFAPVDNPKIVVGIAVEEGIHGAYVAKYPVRAIVHYLTGKSIKADVNTITRRICIRPTPIPVRP